MKPSKVSEVCLAISSYRNDEEVLALLERFQPLCAGFARILVVDSLGTGRMIGELERRGWDGVLYVNSDTNLGSAGNLARRLELATTFKEVRWVYAVNHDGDADLGSVERLTQVACEHPDKLGAVYPLRKLPSRGNTFDVTGVWRVPLRSVRTRLKPRKKLLDVYWSSSNGALYSAEPIRRGLLPWADLWMGYEDLGYGWSLNQGGYRQLLAAEVEVLDPYEYAKRAGIWMVNKPSWYAYYYARNFILVARRTKQPFTIQAAVIGRVLAELGVSATLRSQRAERVGFLLEGIRDGLQQRAGKWRLP